VLLSRSRLRTRYMNLKNYKKQLRENSSIFMPLLFYCDFSFLMKQYSEGKLRTYTTFKVYFGFENYLSVIGNFEHRKFEKLQEATERKHRQEIQRLLKDTNEKEEELLKQIDEREVNVR
jgi:hypothetical protein